MSGQAANMQSGNASSWREQKKKDTAVSIEGS